MENTERRNTEVWFQGATLEARVSVTTGAFSLIAAQGLGCEQECEERTCLCIYMCVLQSRQDAHVDSDAHVFDCTRTSGTEAPFRVLWFTCTHQGVPNPRGLSIPDPGPVHTQSHRSGSCQAGEKKAEREAGEFHPHL